MIPVDNILVTGGAGYIGAHACKRLAAAGQRTLGTVERKMPYLPPVVAQEALAQPVP